MNGIFENINVRQLPTHHPLMFIVANISGVNDKDKFTCELVLDDQNQKQIAIISQEVKVDPRRNFGFIGQFVNVRYETGGNYLIKFYIDNKEIGSHSYKIRQV